MSSEHPRGTERIDISTLQGQGSVNEDLASWRGAWAWVMDGATPIEPRCIGSYQTQAQWLVHTFQASLIDQIDRDDQMGNSDRNDRDGGGVVPCSGGLLARCADSVARRWDGMIRTQSSDSQALRPSMTMALVHSAEDLLSISVIGDCSVYVLTESGKVLRFTDPRVSEFERRTLRTERKFAGDPRAGRMVKEQRTANRQMMNRPGGYWVITPSREWCGEVRHFSHERTGCAAVLLCTDGFGRLFELYEAVDPLDVLRGTISLDRCQSIIRQIENDDHARERYPRVKGSDDSTAVLLTLGPFHSA